MQEVRCRSQGRLRGGVRARELTAPRPAQLRLPEVYVCAAVFALQLPNPQLRTDGSWADVVHHFLQNLAWGVLTSSYQKKLLGDLQELKQKLLWAAGGHGNLEHSPVGFFACQAGCPCQTFHDPGTCRVCLGQASKTGRLPSENS